MLDFLFINRLHRKHRLRLKPYPLPLWFAFALMVSLISACGGASNGPVPTDTPASAPIGTASSADSSCPAALIDTWLKYSAANTKAFIDLMNASASIKSDQALAVATQLGQFEGRVLATQAPGCAAAEKQAIQQMMDGVLQAFKAFAQVPALTLKNSSALALANAQYAQIQKMQQDLITKFTAQTGHP